MRVYPTEAEFVRLARHGNVIPVYGAFKADLETPVSALLKLDDGRYSFLLESVEGEARVARYSFLGTAPRMVFSSTGRHIEQVDFGARCRPRVRSFVTRQDPLVELERLMAGFRPVRVPGLPRFFGGFVGYLGYDIVQFLERLPRHRTNDLRLPDVMLMLADSMAIFDHAQHTLQLVVNVLVQPRQDPAALYRQAVRRIEAMAQQLQRPLPAVRRRPRRGPLAVRSNTSRAEFTRMVARAKQDIRAGEIIQAVLSQRFERSVGCQPFDIYRSLRSLNPSPYMFFLRFGDVCLVGSSPEMLVRSEDGHLETRPIAGTRRRGATPREDERLARQLLASPKERAEHLMLVDLGRNDLGRIARPGSVRTPEFMTIERYSHVLHLVSSVTATLRPGRTAFDVLRATFPAGTVTGAPKVRAMEIIAQLERCARGPYAGAVGYISFTGNLDTCITIRTILTKGRRAYVQAGAGIVADSQPSREYQETVNKARGMLEAIAMAEQGSDPKPGL